MGGGGSESEKGGWNWNIGRKRWGMSFGEVHLDFQIKNSHCSRNISTEAGRLGKGREGG